MIKPAYAAYLMDFFSCWNTNLCTAFVYFFSSAPPLFVPTVSTEHIGKSQPQLTAVSAA